MYEVYLVTREWPDRLGCDVIRLFQSEIDAEAFRDKLNKDNPTKSVYRYEGIMLQ